MKKTIVSSVLGFSFVSILLFGQACEKASARERSCKVCVGIPGKPNDEFSLLSTFDLGFTDFTSADYSMYPLENHGFMDLKNGKSTHVGIYLFEIEAPVNRRRTVGFSSALGLLWNDYTFSDDITLVMENGTITPKAIDGKYKKSKFTTFALTVPVVFGFNNDDFSISGGVYGNLVLSQHTKYKKPKHKEKGLSYANMLQGGLTARVGYKGVSIFANYSLSNLFKKDKGPGGQPLTVGIGLF